MSRSAPEAFVKDFDDEVKHAYQGGGKLREVTTVRNNVEAESYQFQRLGTAVMSDHARQSKFEPANIEHTNQVANLVDKRVADLTDLFDDDKMNISERQEFSKTFGKAMGRQEDQVIYDTIETASFSGDQDISKGVGGNDAMNTTKLRNAKAYFDEQEVPRSERYVIWTPDAQQQLLGTESGSSSDYDTIKALVDGEKDTWLGFTFKELPTSREEGGITVNSDIANNYAVHKKALGLAIGTGPRTDVDWSPEWASWLTQAFLSLGGAVRDPEGLVRIQTDQTVDVTQGSNA